MAFELVNCSSIVRDKKDRTLLIYESNGKLAIPGGRREPGEKLKVTAARETWEETGGGLAVKGLRFFNEYSRSHSGKPPVRVYWAERFCGRARLPIEWVTLDDAMGLHEAGQLRSDWVAQALRDSYSENEVELGVSDDRPALSLVECPPFEGQAVPVEASAVMRCDSRALAAARTGIVNLSPVN